MVKDDEPAAVDEPSLEPPSPSEPLLGADVGLRVIRGGALRVSGYGLGVLLAALASIILLRYLGVDDFGRFATVTSLVALMGGLADAGLGTVGARDLAQRPAGAPRRQLLANLLGLRLALAPLAGVAAVVFALAAGYDTALVAGVALASGALIVASYQATVALPLYVELRAGTITALDLLQQALMLAGIALLVAVGAGLAAFFAVALVVAAAGLAATLFLPGADSLWRPSFELRAWRTLVRELLPLAAATVVNVVYFRVLIVLMSLLATAEATGLFATSFRITQMLLGVSSLALTLAVPVLAAAAESAPRLRVMFERLLEVAAIASTFIAIVVAIAAVPILRLLGGGAYVPAAPVLRIQVFALVPLFVGQACGAVLVTIRRQKVFLASGGAALALVVAAGLLLIPPHEAIGAAVAALIAESGLTGVLLVALLRGSPELTPSFRFVWKVALATAAAAACALVPALPSVATAALAAVAFGVVVWLTRALPPELIAAIGRRRAA